jgi:general secretion pathway protein G
MRNITLSRRQKGMSRFEVLVSATLVLILISLLLDRLLYYQEQSEKVVMEMTARQLDSALRIRAAELMLSNRNGELPQLERTNPFTLFDVAPSRYGGETDGSDAASVTGVWRYDRQKAQLLYVPAATRHLSIAAAAGEDGAAIRYRVKLLRAPPDAHIAGVRLERLTEYHWFE